MNQPKIVVLDYGCGNLHSATRALAEVGAEVKLSADPKLALTADGLLVPGVGSFAACMAGLAGIDGAAMIRERLASEGPVLGICVGHQIFFEAGLEHGLKTSGLGFWPGVVAKLQSPILPHMGWNMVRPPSDSRLFSGLAEERFYFVHSYARRAVHIESLARQKGVDPRQITYAEYGGDCFVAAMEDGVLSSTQFHPEKSGAAGLKLLSNWVSGL